MPLQLFLQITESFQVRAIHAAITQMKVHVQSPGYSTYVCGDVRVLYQPYFLLHITYFLYPESPGYSMYKPVLA